MKKQLLKFSFVALSLLVVGVNTYAQFTGNKTLKNEGTRQIIAGARRIAATNGALDGLIPTANNTEDRGASKREERTFPAATDFMPLQFSSIVSRQSGYVRFVNRPRVFLDNYRRHLTPALSAPKILSKYM